MQNANSGSVGILCVFGGPIANRIGMNWTLLLGAVGYPIYSWVCAICLLSHGLTVRRAALYTNNRYVSSIFSTILESAKRLTGQRLVCACRRSGMWSIVSFSAFKSKRKALTRTALASFGLLKARWHLDIPSQRNEVNI